MGREVVVQPNPRVHKALKTQMAAILADLERIAAGDERAKACFRCFGEQLCDALQPQIEAFCPDTLCMGGQIMESAALFLHPLEKLCTNKKITLYITQDTSLRTMQGLTRAASR